MLLAKVKLQGFRNFKKATINFNEKSLIIGANDVGKTNLIWALRLLLDKGLSEYDIEPKDSDFYAYESTDEFKITLIFEKIEEECILSKLKGKISDDGKLYIAYHGYRDKTTKSKTYKILTGSSMETLEEVEERFYRKVLNIRYISSRRDFYHFIGKEKNNLFQLSKQNRSAEDIKNDDKLYGELTSDLKSVDEKIPKLSYIANATETINSELEKLSIHHKKQKIVFDASSSDVDSFINNVSIASKTNEKSLLIGGDGRLNQIYLSLWAAKNEIAEENLQEVSIICIEEPEAHLHPHQQRKLAEYLNETIKTQVIITTHSPQIASEYSPNSIIRLFEKDGGSKAASNGCSKIIEEAFDDFGYRLSIIPAEAFFADVVFLVEGPSEEFFYKTLAKQTKIDIDRLNISILSANGVGFETFVKILNSLEIDWVLRTDQDITKIPKTETYRFAGIERCVSFYKATYKPDADLDSLLAKHSALIHGFSICEEANIKASDEIRESLKNFNLFIADKDLETDLFESALKSELKSFYFKVDESEIVSKMQEKKAIHMFNFLKVKKETLSTLRKGSIIAPLLKCKKLIESYRNESN